MTTPNQVWHIGLAGSLRQQLKALRNQVGSCYLQRENFHLTPEVKGKFTEKLRSDPREFHGHKSARWFARMA